MRKNEYDFYVDDQITFNKYQLTLKCKYYTKITTLKQYLLKYIKKNFDIIHNDVTLKESMTLDEVFSRYCQNAIILFVDKIRSNDRCVGQTFNSVSKYKKIKANFK
ncbi:unnamed protein product (macronuclear) [Paramecium tetraurelia]|uniref:Uncharacterized protein n=1 Tax=Paramecium tetraurelia TaxID=5888 RepID=A0E4S6_PARTE|nr:uncharacterized protein GSPATT00023468001 [Paramecium tetraurelia]CAK90293.1 unnamed protein product [Paramecium tetraurelia]|eukprot:XP_001457690.1 hypothetical protein (macronuclear) [Paramecium tetraurelia strain d4-2]